jgi:WD40 repeat protein
VVLWDASTRKPIGSPLQGGGSMAFSPDGKTLAVRESDDLVRLVDVETGRPRSEPLLTGGPSIYELVFSPDGRMLAAVAGIDTPGKSAVEKRNVLLWELSGN